MVEPAGEQHQSGNQYHVRIDLGVPTTRVNGARTPRWYFGLGHIF